MECISFVVVSALFEHQNNEFFNSIFCYSCISKGRAFFFRKRNSMFFMLYFAIHELSNKFTSEPNGFPIFRSILCAFVRSKFNLCSQIHRQYYRKAF